MTRNEKLVPEPSSQLLQPKSQSLTFQYLNKVKIGNKFVYFHRNFKKALSVNCNNNCSFSTEVKLS